MTAPSGDNNGSAPEAQTPNSYSEADKAVAPTRGRAA